MPTLLKPLVLPHKQKELDRDREYIEETGEMGGLRSVKYRAMAHERRKAFGDRYTEKQIADAWEISVDVVARLGKGGFLGMRYKGKRQTKYGKNALVRALTNQHVLAEVAKGRLRRQEKLVKRERREAAIDEPRVMEQAALREADEHA